LRDPWPHLTSYQKCAVALQPNRHDEDDVLGAVVELDRRPGNPRPGKRYYGDVGCSGLAYFPSGRAARRLAAGADADSDARVVLAEANVGPEGQGMERALAEARASETDPRIARNSATTSAADESRAPVLPNRGGSFRLNLLAFKRRTSIERVAHAPSRVRVLAREDARAAAAAARAEAALISAVAARRRAGTFAPGDERLLAKTSATATSKSEVRVGAETEIADVHGETHPIGTHLLESSGDEAEEDAASLVPPPGSVFVDAR